MATDPEQELIELRTRIRGLLARIGSIGECKGCGAVIYWVRHLNGKNAPYDESGMSHFATCPAAQRFKKENQHVIGT